MQKNIPYLSVLIVLLYGLYTATINNGSTKQVHTINKIYEEHILDHNNMHYQEELKIINSDRYTKEYIIKIINHGSNILSYKGGEMEGGFASKTDAEKIACYTLTLSNRNCKEGYKKDGAMFYTSICGGCHGDDGKGIGGTYPNLTKRELEGIKIRKNFLKSLHKL